MVMTGVVDTDLAQRIFAVRLSELSSGYERLQWRTAHQASVGAEQLGWRSGGVVLASAPGAFQVAQVVPGPFHSLVVRFPSGAQSFADLVGRPGLFAFVSVDRSTGRFINVNFNHRL